MSRQRFALTPFEADAARRLHGGVTRRQQRLEVEYRLAGALDSVRAQTRSEPPRRLAELWRSTCFELFVVADSGPGYWEFNFSPSGDWNAYRFDAYREGMREEPRLGAPSIEVSRDTEELLLTTTLDLTGLFEPGAELRLGVSAVVENADGTIGYWALTHAAERPDFHRREGFSLRIP